MGFHVFKASHGQGGGTRGRSLECVWNASPHQQATGQSMEVPDAFQSFWFIWNGLNMQHGAAWLLMA